MKSKFLVFSLFLSFGLLASCSSDGGSGNPPADSRQVKYEVTATTGGSFNVIYFTATGSATPENFTAVPWTKEVTMQSNVQAVTFNASVANATPGQTITSKVYVGGVVKRQGTSTVQANGTAFVALQPYTFQN
ncbi:MmpS family transport accessory protein [Flavobacterium sp.]